MHGIAYMWNLKKKKNGTSEPIHKAQGRVTDAENSWLPSGERVGGVNWELGFCKQLLPFSIMFSVVTIFVSGSLLVISLLYF